MIKLKDILKEASLSPSYDKMHREWTVLQDVLGTVSDEYKKLIHLPLFKSSGFFNNSDIQSNQRNQITLLTQQKGTGKSWCSTVTQSLYILFNPLRHSIAPMSSLVGSSD